MRILIINGPNMNMLGVREPLIYGNTTYNSLCEYIKSYAERYNITTEFYQSNHEGDIVDKIQNAYGIFDGIIINPAAYTHTSIAIRDAVSAVNIPTVGVHISDISNREDFRKIDYIKDVCIETVFGKGIVGYTEALEILVKHYESKI